jgi:hypothetical protein
LVDVCHYHHQRHEYLQGDDAAEEALVALAGQGHTHPRLHQERLFVCWFVLFVMYMCINNNAWLKVHFRQNETRPTDIKTPPTHKSITPTPSHSISTHLLLRPQHEHACARGPAPVLALQAQDGRAEAVVPTGRVPSPEFFFVYLFIFYFYFYF